ncbi:MAG TPA: tRNA uridine(34) 5-carboxymethylaminomethyl modification radical SAM/GNAT enzyme Elp3 [Nautiliaceae bacterium]|nr:tRNA uridine(34) 5-carboxymethylaminomethyl modification radical SAM/GNAT enzyme Elp3 [Nautiliaceae bacterium]
MNKNLIKDYAEEFYYKFFNEKKSINKIKNELAKKYKLSKPLKNYLILANLDEEKREKLRPYLLLKPTRTLSGVSVIAIMTKPFPCPHGRCIFCPGGKESFFGDTPNSYTGKEPSTMRAILNDYNPFLIVWNRLYQYIIVGHKPTKIEGIIQGGTFLYDPISYQLFVIYMIYKALNLFSKYFYTENSINYDYFMDFFPLEKEKAVFEESKERILKLLINELENEGFKLKTKNFFDLEREFLNFIEKNQEKIKYLIEKEKTINESSSLIKLVALTIETKPDWAKEEDINKMLFYGTTRVELGVQTTIERVLKLNNRGHSVKDNIEATARLKDSSFKITYHIMPGLYGQTREEDLKVIKEIFENPLYRPDSLKIYPTLVIKGTTLYELWKKGKYKAYNDEEIIDFLVKTLKHIPPYVRIMRMSRDIPSNVIEDGVKALNLREIVYKKAEEEGIKIREIRYREIGRKIPKENKIDEYEIKILKYEASYGKEYFISAELTEDDILLGFVRLRIPGKFIFRPEINKKTALIRELHVYGGEVPLFDKRSPLFTAQNKGIGRVLMKKAEEIAIKNKMEKILVISGVGVRQYYYRLGYKKEGPYVSKYLI